MILEWYTHKGASDPISALFYTIFNAYVDVVPVESFCHSKQSFEAVMNTGCPQEME